MKDFLKRNTPVFVIGLVTLLVFVGIIIAAQFTTKNAPTLEKISREGLIKNYNYTKGNKDAKAYLVEFSDFQCPACKGYEPYLEKVLQKYGNNILFAYKHFPLPQHENARQAAIYAQAVGRQGKFFEYGAKLYENQENLTKDNLIKFAQELGVNMDQLNKDLADPSTEQQVSEDIAQGTRLALTGTPSFILNGTLLQVTNPDEFTITVDREMAKVLTSTELNETTQSSGTEPPTAISLPADTEPSKTPVDIRTEDQKTADKNYGTIYIEYTPFGFRPNNIKAHKNQLLSVKNTTKAPMRLQQIIESYAELSKPVTIEPEASFELRLSKEDLWTFKEASQRHYGTIYVVNE